MKYEGEEEEVLVKWKNWDDEKKSLQYLLQMSLVIVFRRCLVNVRHSHGGPCTNTATALHNSGLSDSAALQVHLQEYCFIQLVLR